MPGDGSPCNINPKPDLPGDPGDIQLDAIQTLAAFGKGKVENGCTWISISAGNARPGSMFPLAYFRIRAQEPTPSLFAPTGMRITRGWSIYALSSARTGGDVPRSVYMLDTRGVPVAFTFLDNESIAEPSYGQSSP